MLFIMLGRFKQKPTKATIAQLNKIRELPSKEGTKILATYWTLGRYDAVNIVEAKDEKAMMSASIRVSELMTQETMVAVTREEAVKLVE
jgi:uncharacterized protein with GYD domain